MYIKHYSVRTEKSYTYWMKKFYFFHNKKYPKEIEKKINYRISFLSSVMSTLDSRIKSLEFYSCIIGSKLPIDNAIF